MAKKKEVHRYHLSKEEIKSFVKKHNEKESLRYVLAKHKRKSKKKKTKEELALETAAYSVYAPNSWGTTANKYMKKQAESLLQKHPKWFKPLFVHFKKVEINILSTTYVSMLLFYSLLSIPLYLILFSLLNLSFKLSWFLLPVFVLVAFLATVAGFYFYPASLIGQRQKKIKHDLTFALIHMSAVAGSGANPISIFELLAESDDYPELKKEIKKILNLVNLFGYSLTTALRAISLTTPSEEFKGLLNGLISTIESGGDLRNYLAEKAKDAISTYRLDRQKQVEALGTYSDVYTSILIAAPLLIIVTLAIINSIGGQIGGMSVTFVSWMGIGVLLPLMNLGFMAFLQITQPEL